MRVVVILGFAFFVLMLIAAVLFLGVVRNTSTPPRNTIVTTPTSFSATLQFGPSLGPLVNGSGTRAVATRSLAPFTKIEVQLSGDFTVQCGQAPGITLAADDNLIQHIQTKVANGVLTISSDCSYSTQSPLSGTITVGTLDAADLRGAGSLKLNGLDTKSLTLDLNGSGTITAQGKTGTLSAQVLGSGDLNLYELDADDVTATVQGSGDIEVKANKSLNASVLGSGDIRYKGAAKTNTSVQGSGSIQSQNAECGE